MTEMNNPISLNITKFPQNLIIPNVENTVSIQIKNTLSKDVELKFAFQGENLNVDLKTKEFINKVVFQPNETKTVNLSISPSTDGIGKLIINAYWLKIVEYKVKVQKLRNSVSSSKINKILGNKNILPIIKTDFDANYYFSGAQKGDIKKLEKELKTIRNGSPKNNLEIDKKLEKLAKSYLSINEFYKALETALEISDQEEKTKLYYNMIRAYAVVNFEESLKVVKNLNEITRKRQLIRDLAVDFALVDIKNITNILSLLDDNAFKKKVVIDVISKIAHKNVSMAMELFEFIPENITKIKILFNFIKILHEKDDNEDIKEIIKKIHQLILSSSENLTSNNQPNYIGYEFLKESICVLAELECPESADSAINDIPKKEIRDKLAQDLFDEIYEMVDETRTKIEPTLILSQYYNLNTYSSKINNEVRNFALIGGNLSDNLLTSQHNFNIAFLSLFSLNFSIFPFLDRIYSKFKLEKKKNFAYYIYPSINNHDEEEKKTMQRTLIQFFHPERIQSNLTIFNFDLIPHLGQPTVIISSKSNLILSQVQKKLKSKVNFLIDDEIFAGGESTDFLKQIFKSKYSQIYNLILSYEFINDLSLLEEFIERLTS